MQTSTERPVDPESPLTLGARFDNPGGPPSIVVEEPVPNEALIDGVLLRQLEAQQDVTDLPGGHWLPKEDEFIVNAVNMRLRYRLTAYYQRHDVYSMKLIARKEVPDGAGKPGS